MDRLTGAPIPYAVSPPVGLLRIAALQEFLRARRSGGGCRSSARTWSGLRATAACRRPAIGRPPAGQRPPRSRNEILRCGPGHEEQCGVGSTRVNIYPASGSHASHPPALRRAETSTTAIFRGLARRRPPMNDASARRGTSFAVSTRGSRSGGAPGLAQSVGLPLRAGQQLRISGTATASTALALRVTDGRSVSVVEADRLGFERAGKSVVSRRGAEGWPGRRAPRPARPAPRLRVEAGACRSARSRCVGLAPAARARYARAQTVQSGGRPSHPIVVKVLR